LDWFVVQLKKFCHNAKVQNALYRNAEVNVIDAEKKHKNDKKVNHGHSDKLLRRALPFIIIKAMMKHLDHPELQESGCYFLVLLARYSESFRLEILGEARNGGQSR
jgi:hypothetical protein